MKRNKGVATSLWVRWSPRVLAARVPLAPTDSLAARPRRRWLALRPSFARGPPRVRAHVHLTKLRRQNKRTLSLNRTQPLSSTSPPLSLSARPFVTRGSAPSARLVFGSAPLRAPSRTCSKGACPLAFPPPRPVRGTRKAIGGRKGRENPRTMVASFCAGVSTAWSRRGHAAPPSLLWRSCPHCARWLWAPFDGVAL